MAFLAELAAVYRNTQSRAAQLKKLLSDEHAAMIVGPVSANAIRQLLLTAIAVKAENQAAAATPGIAGYARTQEGNLLYDVVAEWTAMNAAIDALRDQIVQQVPTGTGGFVLTETWAASGVSVRTFATTQTATLRARMQDIIDAIA